MAHKLFGLPAPVAMLFLAVLVKLARAVSPPLQEGAFVVYKFFSTAVTYPLLFAIGVAMTPWDKLTAAFTIVNVVTIVSTVATLMGTGFVVGRLMKMYPIDTAIVNACHSGQGGTGDVAILTAANRMQLMPFAQIATRIGGAIVVTVTLIQSPTSDDAPPRAPSRRPLCTRRRRPSRAACVVQGVNSGVTPGGRLRASMRANVQKSFKGIPWWGWASAGVLYVCVAAAAVDFAWERAIDALEETGAHRLDLYASSLKSELGRFEILPGLVARQDGVRAMLKAAPHEAPELVHTVNTYLEAVNRDAGSGAVDVIDLQGDVIAASNWNETLSFVGTNVSYRPYFKDALARSGAASSASAPTPACRASTSPVRCATTACRSAWPP